MHIHDILCLQLCLHVWDILKAEQYYHFFLKARNGIAPSQSLLCNIYLVSGSWNCFQINTLKTASLRQQSSYNTKLVPCYFCRCKDDVNPPKKGYKFTNQPLKDLGIRFTPVHEYLYEAVKSLQEKGFLPKASVPKVNKELKITENSEWYIYQSLYYFNSLKV